MLLGLGFRCCCCCCCCSGLGLLLLLATLFLPARRRFSIALSLSSNLFSMSAMMVSMAAWVMGASRTSCGMPVGLGVLGVLVVLAALLEEEESVVVCRCDGGAVGGAAFFPLSVAMVADCCARFHRSLACLWYGVFSGVKLPESVPGTVEGRCGGGGREENLTLLSSGRLESGAWMLSPIPVPSVFWPPHRVMAVSWVFSPPVRWVCGTRMSGEGVAVGECSIMSRAGDEAGSTAMADSCVGW